MNSLAFHKLSYGVYVITTWDKANNRPTGCIANSAMQITSQPPTVALSMNVDNYTNSCIKESGLFAICILSEDADIDLIRGFGFRCGKDANKFEGVAHTMIESVPVLDDCCGYIVCKVVDSMEAGTHTVFLGEVVDAEVKDGEPMTYAYYHKVKNGKSPKNAPTYLPKEVLEQAEIKEEKTMDEKKWVCTICGYVYDEDEPFENLPEDYECPVCAQPKSVFEQQ